MASQRNRNIVVLIILLVAVSGVFALSLSHIPREISASRGAASGALN
jgi:hypothetical protein|tara:strand:+ start:7290 stop:7430 length:141 start_codon:yes stop_codon:yes gene_type:complete